MLLLFVLQLLYNRAYNHEQLLFTHAAISLPFQLACVTSCQMSCPLLCRGGGPTSDSSTGSKTNA